jgi:hypothetical protein
MGAEMDDLEDRVRQLENMVENLTELAGMLAAEIARLKFGLEAGVQQSDVVQVKQQVREARQLALAALSGGD